jgi:GTP-binding protein
MLGRRGEDHRFQTQREAVGRRRERERMRADAAAEEFASFDPLSRHAIENDEDY